MKRILLQYFVWEREYAILDILKAELEKRNMIVGYAHFFDISECLEFQPDIIVTRTIRGDILTKVLSVMKLATGAVIIPMTVEGFYNMDSVHKVISMVGANACPIDLIDYHIMWGEKAKEKEGEQLLRLHKISSIDKIKVFGYIFYEKQKILAYAKECDYYSIFAEWRKKYKRIIACITGFARAEETMEDVCRSCPFTDKEGSEQYKKEVDFYEKLLVFIREYRSKYIEDIVQFANTHPHIGIVVKLHPAEINAKNMQYYSILRHHENILLVDREFPISAILEEAQMLVHYGSTTALEAYVYEVPTILRSAKGIDSESFDIVAGDERFHIYTEKVNINDYDEFQHKLENGIEFRDDPKAEATLAEVFNWKKDAEYCPSAKMADFLSSDLVTTKLQVKALLNEGFVSKKFLQQARMDIYKKLRSAFVAFNVKKAGYYLRCACKLMPCPFAFLDDTIEYLKYIIYKSNKSSDISSQRI